MIGKIGLYFMAVAWSVQLLFMKQYQLAYHVNIVEALAKALRTSQGNIAMWKPREKKARLRDDVPKRFKPEAYKAYQTHIKEIGVCQVCDISTDLDTPHHTLRGIGFKDDRSIICICIKCHDILHRIGYETLNKSEDELKEIGRLNWDEYGLDNKEDL